MMSSLFVRGFAAAIPAEDAGWQAEVPAHVKRRDPRIWQLAYVAAARLLGAAARKPRSLCVGTALGALDETKSFLDGVFKDGFGSPRNFIASVHNSMAGKLALEFSIDGPNLTLCDGQNSFASALASAAILPPDAFPCLVAAVDESIPLLRDLAPHLSSDCASSLPGPADEGAVALLVSKDPTDAVAAIRAVGPRILAGQTPEECAAGCARLLGAGEQSGDCLQPPLSYLGAPLRIHALLSAGRPGRHVAASYSPSSKACAVIEVTL
jgi:hypothetical protein